MNAEEFEEALQKALAQLDPRARELIETVIAGAEANHTAAYMALCVVMGAGLGWALCALTG